MDFSFIQSGMERGTNFSLGIGDRRHNVFFSTALTAHMIIGSPMQQLVNGTALIGEALNAQASDLTHSGFSKLAGMLIDRNIKRAFSEMQKAIPMAQRNLSERMGQFDRPRFSADIPHAVRVEQRQWARSLTLPHLMENVQRDPGLAAAIVEGGPALSKLPPDIFARLQRDMAVHNATTRFLAQQSYSTTPTPDDPVGGKLDEAAARRDGEACITALESEGELLSEAPGTLSSVVNAVALIVDEPREAAFARLTA